MAKISEILKNSKKEKDKKNKVSESTKSITSNSEKSTLEKAMSKAVARKEFGYNTLASDIQTLNTSINNAYSGWQSKSSMDNIKTSYDNILNRLGKYQDYLETYTDNTGLNFRKSNGTLIKDPVELMERFENPAKVIQEYSQTPHGQVTSMLNSYKGISGDIEELSKLYGDFDSADAFKKAKDDAKKAQEEYEKIMNEDIHNLQNGLDNLKSKLETAQEYKDKVDSESQKLSNVRRGDANVADGVKQAQKELDNYLKSIGYKSFDDLANDVNKKKTYYRTVYNAQSKASKETVVNAKDFEEYAKKGASLSGERESLWDGGLYKNPIQTLRDDDDLLESYEKHFEELGDMAESIGKNQIQYLAAKYMTDEELKIYNYYLGSGRKDEAEAYLETFATTLRYRQGEDIYGKQEGLFDKYKLAYKAGIDQFTQGAVNLFNTTDDYIPVTGMQIASEMVREDVKDDYGFVGQVGYDVINTGSNMLPSVLTSYAVGTINPALGANVGTGLMGISAAGNAYQEMLNLGYDKGQARTYSAIIGVSEATLNKALSGVSAFGGTSAKIAKFASGLDNAAAKFAIKFGGSMVSEGFEEGLQEILNPIIFDFAAGYDTDQDINWEEVAYSALLGGLTGGVMDSPHNAISTVGESIQTRNIGKTIKANERVGEMMQIADTPFDRIENGNKLIFNDLGYKTSEKYAKKGITADNISNAKLGNLYTKTTMDAQNILASEYATDEQKLEAFKTLGKLGKMADATVAKEKAKLKVGEETKITRTGEKTSIKGLKVEGNDVIVTTDSGEISVEKMTLSDRDADLVAYARVKAETDGDAIANAFLENYDGKMDLEDYNTEFEGVVLKTKARMSDDEILNKLKGLTGEQASSIYQATIKTMRDSETAKINEAFEQAKKFIRKKGTINDKVFAYDNNAKEGQVNWKDLSSRQREAVTFANGLFSALGNNIVWTVGQKYTNGAYSYEDNTFYIDVNATAKVEDNAFLKDTIISTVSHELTHQMRLYSNDTFRKVADLVLDAVVRKNGGATTRADLIATELARLQKAHPDQNYNEEDAIDEIVARACEDMLSVSKAGKELFNSLSESEKKTLANRIKKLIEDITKWIDELLKKYKSSSFEAKALREMKENFDKVSKMWDKMLLDIAETNKSVREGNVEIKEVAEDEKVMFSEKEIIGVSGKSYGIGVYLDSNLLTGLTESERKQMVKEFVVNELAGKHFIAYDNNNNAVDIGIAKQTDSIKKHNGKKRKVVEELYRKNINKTIKQEAVILADELIKTAKYDKTKLTKISHGWLDDYGKNDWDYWNVYIQEKNKSVWEATLNIANTANGEKILYDIEPIKKVEGPVKSGPTTTNNSISNSNAKVNTKFSDKDSTGKELSKGQQEYFKDSKVRDENGNLLVMYRGDSNDFTVLDRKKTSYANLYGRGFYFTKSKEHAEQYGNAREFYLDIKNPLSPNQNVITKKQLLKFLKAIENDGEDYDLYNYGQNATAESVLNLVWGKGDFEMLQDISAGAVGDMIAAVELFNEVNGTNYDGFILPTETVTFNSEQAKLTSNLNPTSNPNIHYSDKVTEQEDAEYLELAKNPEQNEARLNEMVREAARRAGYTTKAYHGTPNNDFTVFDKNRVGKGTDQHGAGFYFATNKDAAHAYGTRVIDSYLDLKNPIKINGSTDEGVNLIDAGFNYLLTESQAYEVIKRLPNIYDNEDSPLGDYYDSYWENGAEDWMIEDLASNEFNRNIGYLDSDLFRNYPNELHEALREVVGYDGIEVTFSNGDKFYVAWFDTQMKSADTITYDDNRNIIPLSERFNKNNKDIRYQDKSQESIYDIMGENERLRKQNEFYKEETERLKERLAIEKKVTKGNYFDSKQIGTVAELLRKKGNSSIDKVELMKDLKGIYSYIAEKGSNIDEDYLKGKLNDVASKIVAESTPETVSNDYAKEILKSIRTARVTVSETQKAEAQHIFGKGWNRNFFGKANIVSEKGIPLEDMWQEWAREYPTYFDENVSDADMLGKLYEIIGDLQDASELVQEYDKELLTNDLAVEIFRCYWNISPIKTTADKYTERINKLNAEHKKALAELRKELKDARKTGEWMVAEQKLADDIRFKRAYEQLRDRKNVQIAYAKQKGKERLDTYKENAERKTKIQSITTVSLSLMDMLHKNSKDKHVPDAMKGALTELLTAIDYSSKSLLKKGVATQKDERIKNALSKLKDSLGVIGGDADMSNMLEELYGYNMPTELSNLVKHIERVMRDMRNEEFILNNMSLEQLYKLDNILKVFRATINKVNQFHTIHHNAGVKDLARKSVEDIAKRKKVFNDDKKHKELVRSDTYWNNLIPYYAFKTLGPHAQLVFKSFQDAQDKMAFNSQKLIEFTNGLYTEQEYKQWSEKYYEFEVVQPNGKTAKFSMNIPQLMSLYCVSKQEDARRHILYGDGEGGGGISIAETDKKKAHGKNIRINETVLNNMLSIIKNNAKVKEVADKLQHYMGTVGAELGNEVTMARWGIKSFGIENYFPIKVSEGQANNLEDADKIGEVRNNLLKLLSMSFTHARNEYAKQSIEIGDVFDVFSDHMSSMIQYNAFALPVLDMNKWMKFKETDEYGMESSLQEALKDTFGTSEEKSRNIAHDYLTKFLADINGVSKSDDRIGKVEKFFKNAKISKVAFNLRVIALQPTSYFRAGAVIETKYLRKALLHKPKIAKAKEKCGMAAWKALGYYDINISNSLNEKVKHTGNWKDKVVDWSLKGIEKADSLTMGYLWNACELKIRETRKDLVPGSDKFFEAINNELRDVIYRTQVVDSTLTRSQTMRSKGLGAKFLTAFASESTLSLNLVEDAYTSYKLDSNSMGKKAAWNKNKKYIAKTVSAYVVTSLVTSMLQTLFDALRDHDEEDKDEEYWAMHMLTNTMDNLSVLNKIPVIKTFSDVINASGAKIFDTVFETETSKYVKYYGESQLSLDWVEDIGNSAVNFTKWLADGCEDDEQFLKALKGLSSGLSDYTGIGAYNLNRDIYAIIKLFSNDE